MSGQQGGEQSRGSGRGRRPAARKAQASVVAGLAARRDDLDRAQAERRRREDELFQRYAAAVAQLTVIDDAAAERVDALQQQVAQVKVDADRQRESVLEQQAAALAAMADLGRSVDDLATLVELPVKRVRRLVQQGRKTGGTAVPSASGLGATQAERTGPSNGRDFVPSKSKDGNAEPGASAPMPDA